MGLNHGEGALGPSSHTLNQIETIGDNFCDRTDNPTIDDPDQGQHPPFLYRKNSHKGQEEEGK